MENKSKSEVFRGVEYKFSSDWIRSLESETHWRLYWQQQKIMQDLVKPKDTIFELGLGSGFTANYLRSKGFHLTTLDIDSEKNPDIRANIVEYQFERSYDHILAFEVLEHIPFEECENLLRRLSKVCKRYLFLSVPECESVWFSLSIKVPKLKKLSVKLARNRGVLSATSYHFWEVSHGVVSRTLLEATFRSSGFEPLSSEKAFSRWFYTLRPDPVQIRNKMSS